MQQMIPDAAEKAEALALQREIYAIVDGRGVQVALNSMIHVLAKLITEVAEDPRDAARQAAAHLVVCAALLHTKREKVH